MSLIKVLIRKGTPSDLSDVMALVRELALFEKAPNAVTSTLHDYKKALQAGIIDVVVAEIENTIVGATISSEVFSTWKGPSFYLEDFIVKEDYRSKGVGQLLFDAFLEEAQKRGCKQVKWQVLDWNTRAQMFYEKNGATIEKEWWNGKIVF